MIVPQSPLVAAQPLFQVLDGHLEAAIRLGALSLRVQCQTGAEVHGAFRTEARFLSFDYDVCPNGAVEILVHIACEPGLNVASQCLTDVQVLAGREDLHGFPMRTAL
jgi:hypothetical protein